MKLRLLIAVSLIAVCGWALPAWADEMRDAEKKFAEAFSNPENPSQTKVEAIKALGRAGTGKNAKKVATMLVDLLKDKRLVTPAKVAEYEAKIAQLVAEQERIMEDVRKAGNMITSAQKARAQQIDADLAKMRDWVRSNSFCKDAAIEVLGKMDDEEARQEIIKGATSSDSDLAMACLEAFRRMRWAGATDAILKAWDNGKRDANVRAAAVNALRACDPDRGMATFQAALNDSSPFVRSQAILALGSIRKPESIEPLINRMAEEPPGRLKMEILDALKSLTGKMEYADDANVWKAWWNRNKGEFKMPPPPVNNPSANNPPPGPEGARATGAFYGIPIRSKRCIFVIDRSGSMQSSADINDPQGDAQGAPVAPPAGKKSKWQALQEELFKAIDGLPDDAEFAIVWYSTNMSAYKDGQMLKATKREKEAVRAAISAMNADGLTNIYEGLEKAFEICQGSKMQGVVTGGSGEMKADTIFFMTDGSPTCGPAINGVAPQNGGSAAQAAQYVQLLLDTITKWNQTRNLVINCVCVGTGNKEFLEELARRCRGTFKHVVK